MPHKVTADKKSPSSIVNPGFLVKETGSNSGRQEFFLPLQQVIRSPGLYLEPL